VASKRRPSELPKKGVTVNDVAAGGGTGGLLIFVINTWVSDPSFKNVLLYLVPAASIFITGIYSRVTAFVALFTDYHLAKRALATAKLHLAEIEADALASPEHKKEARDSVEEAERAVMLLNLGGFIRRT
jgi:hypothetical protein